MNRLRYISALRGLAVLAVAVGLMVLPFAASMAMVTPCGQMITHNQAMAGTAVITADQNVMAAADPCPCPDNGDRPCADMSDCQSDCLSACGGLTALSASAPAFPLSVSTLISAPLADRQMAASIDLALPPPRL